MAVHRLARTVTNGGVDHICAQIHDPDQLGSLQAVEITQHVVFRSPLGRSSDPDSAARKVRSPAVLHHRAKPVVAGRAAAGFQPYDTEVEVEIAEGVRVRIVRAMITQVLSKTDPAA